MELIKPSKPHWWFANTIWLSYLGLFWLVIWRVRFSEWDLVWETFKSDLIWSSKGNDKSDVSLPLSRFTSSKEKNVYDKQHLEAFGPMGYPTKTRFCAAGQIYFLTGYRWQNINTQIRSNGYKQVVYCEGFQRIIFWIQEVLVND